MSDLTLPSPIARRAAVALAAALCLSITACGKRDEAPAGAPSTAAPASSTPAEPAAAAGSSAPAAAAPAAASSASAQDALAQAKPLASSTASDAKLESVLTGGNNWRSAKQGAAAKDEFVGFELPAGKTLQPHEITIRWVAWHWVPRTLAVDSSDDGKTWSTAASFPVKEPSDVPSRMNGLNRWEETYTLPATAGAHRFWRVRAADIPEANFFGLERISVR